MARKGILRHVLPRIVVDVQGQSERVHVRLEWVGGASATAELIRPVQRWEQLSYYPQLCARVVALANENRSAADIATQLNVEGYRPAKQVEQFGPQGVLGLLRKLYGFWMVVIPSLSVQLRGGTGTLSMRDPRQPSDGGVES